MIILDASAPNTGDEKHGLPVQKPPIKIEVRVEARWLLTLFVLVWSGIAWGMTGVTTYGLLTTPSRIPQLWFLPFALLAAGIVSTSWIVWQLRGREVFEIADEGITLRHTNALFKNRLHLRFDEIESIHAEEDKATPWWIRYQWGIGGGAIAIGHNGRKRRWGIDLSPARAERIAIEMRRALAERQALLK